MFPREGQVGGRPNNSRVDPEDFAQQVNYLAALGRLVVPRAFAFLGRRILFVGHEPFDAEELGNLLPDGVGWYEQQYAPEDYAADIVVLGRVFPKGLVRSVLHEIEGSPKIIPQEGFLDELLFGLDWWSGKRESLQGMIDSYRVLQAVRSLGYCAQSATAPHGLPKRKVLSCAANPLHPVGQQLAIYQTRPPDPPPYLAGQAQMLRRLEARAIPS